MLDLIQGFSILWTNLSPVSCTGCPSGLEHIFPLSSIHKEMSPSAPRQLPQCKPKHGKQGQLGGSLPKHIIDPTKPHVDAFTQDLSWLCALLPLLTSSSPHWVTTSRAKMTQA